MREKVVIAIDVGTQSLRSAVVTQSGAILGIAQILHDTDEPHPGWSQQRPAQWWEETCRATLQVLRDTGMAPESIAAVACCGQMHGPVGIDAAGDITTEWVQLWCDKRCAPQVASIRAAHDESALMARAGNPLNPAWTGIKIRWEKENNPEAYARTRYYLVPKDFINYRLTGVAAADPSEASCSYVYDCTTDAYARELADAIGVDIRKFAPLHPSQGVVGRVTEAAARLTGIPAGTPVVAGGGDFPVSMLGFGIVGQGVLADVTGTSSLLAAHSARALVDPGIQNCRHVVDGWVPFTILDCGGICMKWCKDLMSSIAGEMAYEELIELARQAPPGSDGLVFYPYMRGERRSANINARGAFFAVSLEHQSSHFIRAIMEGVAFAMGKDAGVFRKLGLNVHRLFSVGGGTRNLLWNEIKAGILGRALTISPEPEAGIKGCGLLGAAGVGLIDDPAAEAIARRASSRSVVATPGDIAAYAALQPEFDRVYQHMLGFWQASKA
jgi:xylulokinase